MVGDLIKKHLSERGIKQTYIAKAIGIENNVFSMMLNNKRKITAEEYFRICKAIGINAEYFADQYKEENN
jgi:plasmid maintenance system antidote protein VapI